MTDSARPTTDRHPDAALGTAGVRRTAIDSADSQRAGRSWWDGDAVEHHKTHADFLGVDSPDGEFVWCPEGLHEGDAGLLGDIEGRRVLEIGCGSAPCSRWLTANGAYAVGLDLSRGMLAHGAAAMARGGPQVPLVQAGAETLPFADASFDLACSAFVADSALVMREVARVLRPGGRWVFAVNHPMRWIFLDDPGPKGLVACQSYSTGGPTSRPMTTARRPTSSTIARSATASGR